MRNVRLPWVNQTSLLCRTFKPILEATESISLSTLSWKSPGNFIVIRNSLGLGSLAAFQFHHGAPFL